MPTVRLYADVTQLRAIREFIARASRDLEVDEKVIPCLQLAVDEICANAIKHGYGGQGGEIEIAVESVEDGIQVMVRDWGLDFDPLAVPAPDVNAPLEERPLGGLGLYLVRQMMDDVRFDFRGEGNTVTILKRLNQKGAEDERNC